MSEGGEEALERLVSTSWFEIWIRSDPVGKFIIGSAWKTISNPAFRPLLRKRSSGPSGQALDLRNQGFIIF